MGERGTGKELVAGALVAASRRRGSYCKVNCAALPIELLASELFGHRRGAFTGATERRAGLLASADEGTIFLDEIGDLSPQGQAMLLRVLEDQQVRPLGADESIQVNVRVIAATNRNLEAAVEQGSFRADLLDRLREVVLTVPPLRDRVEDIPLLAKHFLALHMNRHGHRVRGLAPSAQHTLTTYAWPGNVRQLQHALSRAVILAGGRWIEAQDLGLPGHSAAADTTGETDGFPLTDRQREALRIAVEQGTVTRRDLTARLGVSGEVARRALVALVGVGVLRREGVRGRTRYVPVVGDGSSSVSG